MGIILSETEVRHYTVVFMRRYFQGGGKIGVGRCHCKAHKTCTATSWRESQFPYVTDKRHHTHHMASAALPRMSTLLGALGQVTPCLRVSFSSVQTKSWARGPLQSVMIYLLHESNPWNFLACPLVTKSCLSALTLYSNFSQDSPRKCTLVF